MKIPATGVGDTTPIVATEKLGGTDIQFIKLLDGTPGGSQGATINPDGTLNVAIKEGITIGAGYVGASLAGGLAGASVSNFPATQPVSGYLGASIANQPAVQPVSGYLGASLAGGYVGASLAGAASIAGGNLALAGGSTSTTNLGGSVSAQNFGGSTTVFPAAAAVGGASPFHYITGASVNNVNIKNGAGTLYSVSAFSTVSGARYVRIYDKSSTPSVGMDVPIHTYPVTSAAPAVVPIDVGILFANGLGIGVTGGSVGDTCQTGTALGEVVVNLAFK